MCSQRSALASAFQLCSTGRVAVRYNIHLAVSRSFLAPAPPLGDQVRSFCSHATMRQLPAK